MDQQQPAGKSIGKGMLWITWLLVLGGLTLFFGEREKNWLNPNREVQSQVTGAAVEVVLKRNRWGHYLASGTINGHPVTFLVDTGATTVAVPYHMRSKLGLQAGPSYKVQTANGDTVAYSTEINELKIGQMHFQQLRAGLTVGMEGTEILLGMSALRDLELIQRDGQLIMRQQL